MNTSGGNRLRMVRGSFASRGGAFLALPRVQPGPGRTGGRRGRLDSMTPEAEALRRRRFFRDNLDTLLEVDTPAASMVTSQIIERCPGHVVNEWQREKRGKLLSVHRCICGQ